MVAKPVMASAQFRHRLHLLYGPVLLAGIIQPRRQLSAVVVI